MEDKFSIQTKKTVTLTLSAEAFERVFDAIATAPAVASGSEEFLLFLKAAQALD